MNEYEHKKAGKMKAREIFTLDQEVVEELNKQRGIVPKSTYVNSLLRKLLKFVEKEQHEELCDLKDYENLEE
jgi:Arc/MetJ family transcription regulator